MGHSLVVCESWLFTCVRISHAPGSICWLIILIVEYHGHNHLFVILLFQKCNKTKVSGSTYDTDVEFTDWVRVQE